MRRSSRWADLPKILKGPGSNYGSASFPFKVKIKGARLNLWLGAIWVKDISRSYPVIFPIHLHCPACFYLDKAFSCRVDAKSILPPCPGHSRNLCGAEPDVSPIGSNYLEFKMRSLQRRRRFAATAPIRRIRRVQPCGNETDSRLRAVGVSAMIFGNF